MEKRPVLSVGFIWRFGAYFIGIGAGSAALVFLCYRISDSVGYSAAKWWFWIALISAWVAARRCTKDELDDYLRDNPPKPAPPSRFYWRKDGEEAILGPASLSEIMDGKAPDELQKIEVVKALGQSLSYLWSSAVWARLAEVISSKSSKT